MKVGKLLSPQVPNKYCTRTGGTMPAWRRVWVKVAGIIIITTGTNQILDKNRRTCDGMMTRIDESVNK